MKPKRVSFKQKRKEAPKWVFSWTPLGRPLVVRWLPLLFVGSCFALALAGLRIQVTPPKPWKARHVSLIQAVDGGESGRLLAMLAREGGPFPSRFEVKDWSGRQELEAEVYQSVRMDSPAYVPKLHGLDESMMSGAGGLALVGVPMLPRQVQGDLAVAGNGRHRLSPVLRGISGLTTADMPVDLPPMDESLAERMSARDWRFFLRLDAEGCVTECISLSPEDGMQLEEWLRGVRFRKNAKDASRWVAVDLGFANQKADGTGNH